MRAHTGIHVSEDILEKFALDQLAEPELTLTGEHILLCAACQDRLREVDEFIETLQEAAGKNAQAGYHNRPGGERLGTSIN
jgi:sirohydrochlorin ferrochelatase